MAPPTGTKAANNFAQAGYPITLADGSTAYVMLTGQVDASGTATPAGTTADPSVVKAAPYTFLGYQKITAATLASSTAMTVPAGATIAIVQNNHASAETRYRPDGATTAPTSTTGQAIKAQAVATLDIGNAGLTAARFIGGGDLDILYYA